MAKKEEAKKKLANKFENNVEFRIIINPLRQRTHSFVWPWKHNSKELP